MPKRTVDEVARTFLNAHWEERSLDATKKLERILQDDWEIHGDPRQLCLILRDEVKRLRSEPIEALIRARKRAEIRRDDTANSLHERYLAAIDVEAFDRAVFFSSNCLKGESNGDPS